MRVLLEGPRAALLHLQDAGSDELLDLVSNRSIAAFDRSIDNQISRLRKKIEVDPKQPAYIKTVWGGGYTFGYEVTKKER